MFLKKVESEGLAHYSYIIGQGRQAAVIDPRRDCQVYLDLAMEQGFRITHIFETHRNEDYVIGSLPLAELTGAQIFHGEELPFAYGKTAREGDVFELGNVRLKCLKTPGHTFESISLAVYDSAYGIHAAGVFTGDVLFVGDVGRTDFFPGRERETAGLLYDSIFEKLLPLGDQAVIFPAHGAGSVCGAGMAQRRFSTIGFERLNNPLLQFRSREDFIEHKIQEEHARPPYFSRMEEYNLNGPPAVNSAGRLDPLDADEFDKAIQEGCQVLDIRSAQAFAGVHIPGSLSIPLDMVPLYAGWFLDMDRDVLLVSEGLDEVESAGTYLMRIGFDAVRGYLHGGVSKWEVQGKYFDTVPAIYAGTIQTRISEKQAFTLLDIRSRHEFTREHLPGAQNIFLGDLPQRLNEIGPDRPVTTFCGSGQRAMIAASILLKHGFKEVENCFGSLQACAGGVCELISS
ncbi:MAG: MBL fold metallo-hydrolase [Desulfonatronovibrionaceae bacterium]